MNENPPPVGHECGKEPAVHLGRLVLCLLLSIALFDICFWNVNALGFSFGLFFLPMAALILATRELSRWRPTTWFLLALLVGATFAAMVETGFTNSCVLIALIVALAGETFFRDVESPWGRWLSQWPAMLRAPGRFWWLGKRLRESIRPGAGQGIGILSLFLWVVLALVLTIIFGSLLATGNAVFGNWTSNFFTWFWNELGLYLDPVRGIFWLFAALLTLPLLRPASTRDEWWKWLEQIPRFRELGARQGAFFGSALILVVLNLLFLVANTADALFLWSGRVVPPGVDYKTYVHEGVDALIVTVVLTALVLTTIFQQSLPIAQRRELKVLAFIWIAQNIFLILSVSLRIRYYIVTYELTVARLGVIIFLILVSTGYVLLSIKILWDKSLSWLLGGCVIATFACFYITQFLDLEGWSANYNIACWEKDRARALDFYHLYADGPSAWPAMRRAHQLDSSIAVLNANESNGWPVTTDSPLEARFDLQHWREFSLRAWLNRWALEDRN